jgi:multidrug efflux pump subunit AcrA (membrane-fusion protein)
MSEIREQADARSETSVVTRVAAGPATPAGALPPAEGRHEHHIPGGKLALAAVALIAIVGAVWLAGYLPRRDRANAAATVAGETQSAVPVVTAERVTRSPQDSVVVLPGNISAMSEASIYARAAGYVTKRYADIGDHVKAGQLMAEIETPELDQQVAQAQAQLAQARQQLSQNRASLIQAEAQRDLAKVTAQRYDNLVSRGAVARQDADQQESTWKSAEAIVSAQQASVSAGEENVHQSEANLERVTALRDYNKVRAPVAGVVTARNIDVGYLISATGAGQGGTPLDMPGTQGQATAGNEMYRIAQTGTLRILVNVPQSAAPGIETGMAADVLVTEFQGRIFPGKVTRTSNSLDPNSRTLLTQVEIPNTDGKLYPGMYAQVRFRNHRDKPPLLIPGDALINGQAGTQVAIALEVPNQEARRIHLQTIQLGRDYGAQTEVLTGLEGGETVVVNPGDAVREGNLVKVELRGAGKK